MTRRWPAAVALAVLGAFLMASLGWVPSPAAMSRLMGTAVGERFACESCGCGCASARECWTQCCCHTLAERVAWAQREGVAVPEYVDLSPLKATKFSRAEPEPACELCVAVEQESERPTPLFNLSALACKGLTTMLGLAAMPGVWSGGLVIDLPRLNLDLPRPVSQRMPASLALRVPAPPPRCA